MISKKQLQLQANSNADWWLSQDNFNAYPKGLLQEIKKHIRKAYVTGYYDGHSDALLEAEAAIRDL